VALDWALVASQCPQAAALDPAEQLGLEQLIGRWCPAVAPDLARVYLARHLVLVEDMAIRGVLGSATAEKLGPSSVSTDAQGVVLPPDHWGLTSWGVLYLDLAAVPGPELL
jgi:hypothetical protein